MTPWDVLGLRGKGVDVTLVDLDLGREARVIVSAGEDRRGYKGENDG